MDIGANGTLDRNLFNELGIVSLHWLQYTDKEHIATWFNESSVFKTDPECRLHREFRVFLFSSW